MLVAARLIKDFGPHRAVNGVSFTLERGEVLGFLGPNGAGKTTTMRMLAGGLEPDGGKAMIGGHDCVADRLEAIYDQLGRNGLRAHYVGRREKASPASGTVIKFQQQQDALVDEALAR